MRLIFGAGWKHRNERCRGLELHQQGEKRGEIMIGDTNEEVVICDECGKSIIRCRCTPLMDAQSLKLIDDLEEIIAAGDNQ